MIISLAGYMGSGKSHIASLLGSRLHYRVLDLDKIISEEASMSVGQIFNTKGELYFRKAERRHLERLLNGGGDAVLSLGGGTPAYYDNMQLINTLSESVYLQTGIPALTARLSKQKQKRPLIAAISDEDLPEFISKHLFERIPYYTQCRYTVHTDQNTPEEAAEEIIRLLHL